MLESGEEHHQWPASGRVGYLTPAISGVPNAKSGGQNEWADWRHKPCCLGVPMPLSGGTQLALAHKWAIGLHYSCRPGGSPTVQSRGHHQKWPTSGRVGYTTPAVWGIPNTSKRGTSGRIAYTTLAIWGLHNASGRGEKIRSVARVGALATQPLPSRCPKRLRAGDQLITGPQLGGLAT